MRKFLLTGLVISLSVFLGRTIEALKTPYHSLNLNSYQEVVSALKRPEWVANYSKFEFQYVPDKILFGKRDYRQSAREMFFRKKGDCEDYAAFYEEVLRIHDYKPEVYSIWAPSMGGISHAVVVFPYQGRWARIENNYYLQLGYQSKKEALRSFVSSAEYQSFYFWPLSLPSRWYFEPLPKLFTGRERIALDDHLTECQPGFYFYFPTFGYLQRVHKEAIGYLWKLSDNQWNLESAGLGVSSHGFYANLEDPKEYVFSLYLKWRQMGVSIYGGDYNGIDFDLKIISGSLVNYYLAVRNFGEVIDSKLSLSPYSWLKIDLEKNDREYDWLIWLKGSSRNERVKVGFSKNGFQVGINSLLIGGKKEGEQLEVFISLQGI